MTTAEPATEVRAIPTYIAIPASKVLGEGLLVLVVVPVVLPASTRYRVAALFSSLLLTTPLALA